MISLCRQNFRVVPVGTQRLSWKWISYHRNRGRNSSRLTGLIATAANKITCEWFWHTHFSAGPWIPSLIRWNLQFPIRKAKEWVDGKIQRIYKKKTIAGGLCPVWFCLVQFSHIGGKGRKTGPQCTSPLQGIQTAMEHISPADVFIPLLLFAPVDLVWVLYASQVRSVLLSTPTHPLTSPPKKIFCSITAIKFFFKLSTYSWKTPQTTSSEKQENGQLSQPKSVTFFTQFSKWVAVQGSEWARGELLHFLKILPQLMAAEIPFPWFLTL